MNDHGPALTSAEAAALHDRREPVAWFALPAPSGNGAVAWAHTEAHHGGRLLPGHLAADDIDGLRALMPKGLEFDPEVGAGSPPGCLGWWWDPVTGRPAEDGRDRR